MQCMDKAVKYTDEEIVQLQKLHTKQLLKKKNKYKQIGVYGSFDAVRVEEKEGLNFLKLGVFTPTMLVFFILCVIQSVVNGVMLSVA